MKNPPNRIPSLRQKAIAVQYNPEETAPKITAKGAGHVAERIMENARAADIPLHKNAALVEELTRIDLGANIPPELYEVVARVLIFISDLDKNAAE
jgi:flagellar biosynthesis protein